MEHGEYKGRYVPSKPRAFTCVSKIKFTCLWKASHKTSPLKRMLSALSPYSLTQNQWSQNCDNFPHRISGIKLTRLQSSHKRETDIRASLVISTISKSSPLFCDAKPVEPEQFHFTPSNQRTRVYSLVKRSTQVNNKYRRIISRIYVLHCFSVLCRRKTSGATTALLFRIEFAGSSWHGRKVHANGKLA